MCRRTDISRILFLSLCVFGNNLFALNNSLHSSFSDDDAPKRQTKKRKERKKERLLSNTSKIAVLLTFSLSLLNYDFFSDALEEKKGERELKGQKERERETERENTREQSNSSHIWSQGFSRFLSLPLQSLTFYFLFVRYQ